MIVCRQCKERYLGDEPSFCGQCGADLRWARVDPGAGLAGNGAAARDPDHDGDLPGLPTEPLLGRVIGGRYRVLERIGRGGMGVVYKVEHAGMGKLAALKMLHPTLSSERELVKRFRTEARAVSMLTHPNTVQVFDFGESDGFLYLVMELVRGEHLGATVDREGPLSWRRTAPLLAQVCEALAEAHEAGVIHRDIKPENLFVVRARDGRETVKVLDFGLAKLRRRGSVGDTTEKGALIGTPYYMSPEQIRGDEVDGRSDIYSLGATAYDVLTGSHPFEGPSAAQVLAAHLTERLPPMRQRRPEADFDPRVEALVARCLAREPAERFGSADELREAIEALVEGIGRPGATGPIAPVTGAGSVARRVPSEPSLPGVAPLSREDFDRFERGLRRRRFVGVGVVLLVLFLALGGGGWLLLRPTVELPVTSEVEPNDDAARANLIAEGRPVRGHAGGVTDRDFFRFRVAAGPAVAHLDVTGVAGLELDLSLFDRLGNQLAEADAGGRGHGEVIPNARLPAGDYWVEVREVRAGARNERETSTGAYALRLALHPLAADEESEPDDSPADALPVTTGRPMKGYLGRPGDVDFYSPQGESGGTLAGRVSGIPGVDLRVIVLPPGTMQGGDPAAVPGARVFDAGGAGAPEEFGGVAWPSAGAAPLLAVARKDAPPHGGRAATATAFDVPYELAIERVLRAEGAAHP